MKRLTTRQYAILTQLIECEGFVNSDQLSVLVGAAGKTIRKDIESLMPKIYKEYGVDIESKSGLGFCLHRDDSDKFKKFIADFHNAYQSIYPYTNNDYRMHYLMQRLLSAKEHVKINDLCDEIYSSRTIITSTLKLIRRIFSDYDLILEQTPNHGLSVSGKERCKRICLINEYLYFEAMKDTPYEVKDYRELFRIDETSYHIIRETLFGFLKQERNYVISQQGAEKIILAIILLVNRNQMNQRVTFTGEENFETYHTYSHEAANQILMLLSEKLSIEFRKEDVTFIGIIMLGFRNILTYKEVHVKKRVDEAVHIIEDALYYVVKQTGVNEFLRDQTLKERLALHMISMKMRYGYNLIVDYVSGDLVNKKCPIAVEFAVLCCNYIQSKTSLPINRNEVMYMAYLYMTALSRIETFHRKDNNIAIIASIGRDVAISIVETMFSRYPRFVRSLDAFEEYQIDLIKDNYYDYILTDLSLNSFHLKNTKIVPFDFYLRDDDYQKINYIYINTDYTLQRFYKIFRKDLFFNLSMNGTENEIIHELSNCIKSKMQGMDLLESDIRMRNHLTPLENSNNIAFFKTSENYHDETFAAVFFLEKPMIWFRESVQCFIMLSVGEREKEDILLFAEPFANFLNDNQAMLNVLRIPEYDNFMKCLKDSVKGF